MNPYARLVESLLESKADRRARKRQNQGKPISPQPAVAAAQTKLAAAAAAANRRGPGGATGGTDELGNPIKRPTPAPSPVKPSSTPVDRSRVGGATGDTDELGRSRKPEAPAAATPGKPKPVVKPMDRSKLASKISTSPMGALIGAKALSVAGRRVKSMVGKADREVDSSLGGKKLV